MKLLKNTILKRGIFCLSQDIRYLLKNNKVIPTRFKQKYLPIFSDLLQLAVAILVLLPGTTAHAILPAFIKGTVFNTYNSSLITGATISTAGISTTSISGGFALRVPPNVYTLVVSGPELTANILSGILATPGKIAAVSIGTAPSSTPTGYLEGRVIAAGSGDGIQGALILTDLNGATITVGKDGSFRLAAPSGMSTITATAEGFSSKIIKNTMLYPYITTNLTISLDKASSGSITIKGVIRDVCTGARINNAVIIANSGNITLSDDGFYAIDVSPGLTTLIVSAGGYQFSSSTSSVNPLYAQLQDFYLTPSEGGTGLIEGIIYDSSTGEPLDDVRIESNTGAVSFSTNDGEYKLYTSSCTTSVSATLEGFIPLRKPVTVVHGDVIRLNLPMTALGRISGTITDSTGTYGVTGAQIWLGEDSAVSCISADDGSYALNSIMPGNYTLNISHPCFQTVTKMNISVSSGETTKEDISLTPAAKATIEGTITDRLTGDPIASAFISTPYGAHVQSNEKGFYSLEIPACTTDILFKAPGYLPRRKRNVALEDGEMLELDAHLIPCPFGFCFNAD